jgi:hypothetical protein
VAKQSNDFVDIGDAVRLIACTCPEPQVSDVLIQAADLIDELRVRVVELTMEVEKLGEKLPSPAEKGSGGTK